MKTLVFTPNLRTQTPGQATRLPPGTRNLWRWIAPRTMTGLMAGACLLAATPLLLALGLAGSQLDRLTRHGTRLLQQGLDIVHYGTQLHDNLNDLERAVRQYAALQDPGLADLVKRRIAQTEATLQSIEDRPAPPLADPVFTAQLRLSRIAQLWADPQQQTPDSLEALAEQIHGMNIQADTILRSGRDAVHVQEIRLQEASGAAQHVMLVSSLTLIPLTALLAFVFSAAVLRPLRALTRGIVDLGHARYEDPVTIGFPREMRQLGTQVDWLRMRLAQLDADKERFLRNVSHELKTPLASLHEGAGLLQDETLGPLTTQQRKVSSILVDAIDELDGLIDNLLTYAAWRKERRHPTLSWFDAQVFAEEVLTRHQLVLSRRCISTELRVHCERLFGDRSQLRVALENLLSNAIKHAPKETAIDIDVAVSPTHCMLAVRDRGRGVPTPEKRMIFEPFVRGSEAEESEIRGTGIGLSVVHETVLSHNGTVEVEDAEPGARFKMVWPRPADVR